MKSGKVALSGTHTVTDSFDDSISSIYPEDEALMPLSLRFPRIFVESDQESPLKATSLN
jgi:hypothetical protein